LITQAKYIQDNLSDAIDHALITSLQKFKIILSKIKLYLKQRKKKLTKYATNYNKVLLKTVIIVGTNKKDRTNHISKDHTTVAVYRIKKKKEMNYFTQGI
jgi:hypothetical protein